ncbi:lignostilbene alphabeta-dioxygenase I [Fusarium albosuccineum]|uniref:Lignostilbene alphabeta-dioxygenase I n=1 Tax=Fusarium albosuccineum TaxID=1237068 RepID=A0A8H4KYR0_9HYPO|nr:lignostilbene alphabeta-dioxygenase I [Fusarium albosuccineum]
MAPHLPISGVVDVSIPILYLSGNFAPIQQTTFLTPCAYTGNIPSELLGGQYVRNGGNPVSHDDLSREAHWFDGDGMLSGVGFRSISPNDGRIIPEFVNQYILTDLYLSKKTTSVSSPITPSITTLINPISTLVQIVVAVLRTMLLVVLSHLPGSQQAIKRISVANTAILYHDGRALAICESGPPIRIQLPSLDTVGWYDGNEAEGEYGDSNSQPGGTRFGGTGLTSFMKEWTTRHPKVARKSGEMLLYHNTFLPPYVNYSVIPGSKEKTRARPKLINRAVAGVSGARMMHDFGSSATHTIIMDLPLTLDPINLLRNRQVVSYDPSKPSRFGVFPRHEPSGVRWFTSPACCIFHTANTWDISSGNRVSSVHLLACRMTSATLIYSAGNIAPPTAQRSPLSEKLRVLQEKPIGTIRQVEDPCPYENAPVLESHSKRNPSEYFMPNATADEDNDQCCLYYYEFDLSMPNQNSISHQWALSAIPFEFPSVRPDCEMQEAGYVYGCSTSSSCFGAALGRAVKIDVLAKIDATVSASPNHFAQEPRFVPRSSSSSEDSGYLLFYVFDESQLLASGDCAPSSVSELWILDAQNMRDVVAKVILPQRVPYGLHGTWFSRENIEAQREFKCMRSLKAAQKRKQEWVNGGGAMRRYRARLRGVLERAAG